MTWRSVASFLTTPRKMFSATEEPAISRYEDEELIDAAKMPDTTTPHMNGGRIIWDSTMNTFSAWACVAKSTGMMTRPTKPMQMPQASDTTHHTTAMTRDFFTSSAERMPMKRTSTCGMPK